MLITYGDFGFSLKKTFKKATKYVKKAVSSPKEILKTVAAVSILPVVAPATLTTQIAGKAIAKKTVVGSALARVNRAVAKNPILERSRTIGTASAVLGAAVVGGYYAAPVIVAAAPIIGKVAAVAGAAATVAKKTGILPGAKAPAAPGEVQPPLLDASTAEQQAMPTSPGSMTASMSTVGGVGLIAGAGLLALLAFTKKGRR